MTIADREAIIQAVRDETRKVRLSVAVAIVAVFFCTGTNIILITASLWVTVVAGVMFWLAGIYLMEKIIRKYEKQFGSSKGMVTKE
jgi:hypothetical protein